MSRNDLTVIIGRDSWVSASKYRVSHRFLLAFGIALVILFSSFTLSTLHYYYMWKKTFYHDHLKLEADKLREENETFRLSARQLNEKISTLEITSQKLQLLSGSDREGLGGVGGPLGSDSSLLNLDSHSLIRHFRSLARRSISLENNLRHLQELYNTRTILLAATPAIMPVRGYPSGNYGYRIDPFTQMRDFHPGIDISAPRGSKVMATADGLVVFAGRHFGYGKLVRVNHRFGVSTRYGHLSRVVVKRGQKVNRGDIVGSVGSTGRATGPHLHYEVRMGGKSLNPLRFFRDSG